MSSSLSLKARVQSFQYAFDGFISFLRAQPNALLHLSATIVAVSLGVYMHISVSEWLMVVLAVGLVWMAELFNTAIEKICDLVSPQRNPQVKFIKDVAAAGVLITAITAFIIGLIIFIPKFL